MCKGFIMLSRSFFENELWTEERKFSDCECWLDLIQMARYEDTDRTVRVGRKDIVEKRGQVATTLCILAERWGRTKRSVICLLAKLKVRGMITVDGSQYASIITLINYDRYNAAGQIPDQKRTRKTKRKSDTNVTDNVMQDVTYNVTDNVLKEKELGDTNVTDNVMQDVTDNVTHTNKDNNKTKKETSTYVDAKKRAKYFISSGKDMATRASDLWEQLQPYADEYGQDLIQEFFVYWSAPDKGGKSRMLVDDPKIKCFYYKGRLNTWRNNNKKSNINQEITENGDQRQKDGCGWINTDTPASAGAIPERDPARLRERETDRFVLQFMQEAFGTGDDSATAVSGRDSPDVRNGE